MSSALRVLRHARNVPKHTTSIARSTATAPINRFRQYATTSMTPRPAEPKAPEDAEQASEDLSDPNMNGNYPDPSTTSALPLKRQFRDPYGDWWDKQERRNYGEPVHEDNDILGIFSPEQYTHATVGKAAFQMLCFIAAFGSVLFAVSLVYPDKPSAPRTFPDGLERELGGPGALRARKEGEDKWVE